jgi:hypothetical protein
VAQRTSEENCRPQFGPSPLRAAFLMWHLREAFRQQGAFVPQTPEEVETAEKNLDEEQVELPPSLRDPMAILDRLNKPD